MTFPLHTGLGKIISEASMEIYGYKSISTDSEILETEKNSVFKDYHLYNPEW